MNFKIKVYTGKSTIRMNQESAQALGVENLHITVVRFGFKIADTKIEIDNNLPKEVIYISVDIFRSLSLPKSNRYLIKVIEKEIVFGPYLGIYLGTGKRPIKWKYERLTAFVANFSEVNGVVCAFTENDIDFAEMEVNALYYDSFKDVWKQQKMPLPSVIHIYGDMRKRVKSKLRGIYGNNLFNYNEMDKWTEIRVLQSNQRTKKYIPNTMICENINSFREFILKHDDVYFKPVKGRKGRGIHRIKKQKTGDYLLTIQSTKSYEKYSYKTIDDLVNKLEDKIKTADFILQKTIDISINKRVIDFRVRFEKNIENQWTLSLFAARISDPGGVVSNRSAGGEVISPSEALIKHYNFTQEKAKEIKEKLISAGFEITKVVEENNVNYGKCAVDLGLDPEGRVWHIETNVIAPNDLTTRAFENYEGLDRVGHFNILYSKMLSGFRDAEQICEIDDSEKEMNYKQDKKNYNLYIAGRFKNEDFADVIINEVNKNKIEIIQKSIKNTYILINTDTSEKNLLDLIADLRELDRAGLIRTFLYHDKANNKNNEKEKEPQKMKALRIEKNKIKKEINELQKEINELKTSTSWKFSKPIRIVGKLFKQK